jgi:hypothetical protein
MMTPNPEPRLLSFVIPLYLVLLQGVVSGQAICVGVAGGGSFTHGFGELNRSYSSTSLLSYPTHRDYLVGPTIEVGVSRHITAGFDALYRPLNFTNATLLGDGTVRSVSPATVVTWEFPILMKYRFRERGWRPLVEAGPSLRTSGNRNNTSPSSRGAVLGVGLEGRFRALRVTPGFRYTRWAADRLGSFSGLTNQNQAVFVLALRFGKTW